eukprot:Sspe_Gene.59::Locus_21_Transcript_2_2_Confidence_0.500_Length_1679::g.59::m.59/K00128/ALDH; aldehyde dehydrogenase (NAD+)
MDVDKIGFTGSTEVGHLVMKAAAESNLKSVSLELGGKSPLVICEDADLDNAVAAAQVGVFFNQGQVCTASSRIFVHESIHDEFVRKLVAATKKRTQGNPFTDVQMGPQVSKEQHETVYGYIKAGKREGAKCVIGGKKAGDKGYFIQPTIFTDVTDDNDHREGGDLWPCNVHPEVQEPRRCHSPGQQHHLRARCGDLHRRHPEDVQVRR